ncbi:hypothetical protein SCP_0601010 [Sparassis crispa]|uniref:Transmembrane protein n=1 Tax=Sparassis crispa TaxID=139825 RepID=A0A401GPH5_9APHY|nr:hypothetical protein SCP_0601010 [Sparassis crispa]GBE84123.1 hypothetical protein SCP_0601010 [Sparassis crispa]
MVDWSSPRLLEITSFVFSQVVMFSLGVYGWHILLTLRHVELPLAARRLKFRWAFVPYLLARYVLLAFLISLIATSKTYTNLCHKSLKGLCLLCNVALAAASTNLFVRTVTLWHNKLWVRGVLGLFTLGLWAAALTSALTDLHASTRICGNPYSSDVRDIFAFYLSTTVYNAVILVFTVAGLYSKTLAHVSPVWHMLYRQGIWYFVTMLLVNMVVLIFAGLELNPVMNVFFTVPATVVSVISSSQAVVSLVKLQEDSNTSSALSSQGRTAGGTASVKRAQFTSNIQLNLSLCDDSLDLEIQEGGPRIGKAVIFSSHVGDLPDTSRSSIISLFVNRGVDVQSYGSDMEGKTKHLQF